MSNTQHKPMLDAQLSLEENECPGIFFKAYPTRYVSDTKDHKIKVVDKIEMRFLKNISCPGCVKCGGIWEMIREGDFCVPEDAKYGEIYGVFVEESTDWESGITEGEYVGFTLVRA